MPQYFTLPVAGGHAGKRRLPLHRGLAAGVLLAALLATTSLASSAAAAPVGLGTADSSAVLAGSTVTNTGDSVIRGDVGVSPGTVVGGFPPGLVLNGTIHEADAVASQAQADLTTAYDDAAGRSSMATISADLAGSTLTPGVYTSASSLGLSGDLTLDAEGDPNAVFVFQAGSALTVGSSSRVLFIGGARACNVFWQVGSSASIGSGSAFAGNVLALTSISMMTGATLNGRALARNGAVTLDTNRITKPSCAAPSATSPPATSVSATTSTGKPVTVVLQGTDAAGAPLSYAITSGPSHGTLGPIDQRSGTITYTPDAGYSGPDSFTYQVSSPNGTSVTATAAITVVPAAGAGVGSAAAAGAAAVGASPGSLSPARPRPAAPVILPSSTASKQVESSAALSGPSRCVEGPARARVTGLNIAQVTFYVDGKRRRTIKARAGQTVFTLKTSTRGQHSGVHRVTAKVRFKNATARTRTLRLVYQRCSRAAVAPRFTG